MGERFFEHVSNDLLEQYMVGKLEAWELETIKDHLMLCRKCRQRLTEAGILVKGPGEAARMLSDPLRPRGLVYYRHTIRRHWSATER